MKLKINKIFYLTIFLFTYIIFPVYPQSTDELDRIFDKGIEYERANKLDRAVEMYRKALEMNKASNMVKVRLAKVLSWQDNYEDALTLLEEVLEDEKYHSEALFRKAQILSWQGKYNESLAIYQIYLIREKDDFEALMGIARVSFWSGQNEKAIDYFNQAINAGGDEIDARLNLGKVYLNMDDRGAAKEEFNKVLQMDPGNKEAMRFLRDIGTMKTFEVSVLNLIWSIYPDRSSGITASTGLTYHYKHKWDFNLLIEGAFIDQNNDITLSFTTYYRGFQNLYLLGGLSLTPAPDFSPVFSTKLGVDYAFRYLLVGGFNFKTDVFRGDDPDTLFTLQPELQKYFSDITYVSLGYNQYIYATGYNTGTIGLRLNLEYYNMNLLYVFLIYGGDVEVRDNDRRIFDIGAGISYTFREKFEFSLGYALHETEYGSTHQINSNFIVKW